jgi:hypothetical protein
VRSGAENSFLEPFFNQKLATTDHFRATKTGSGQTQQKLRSEKRKRRRFLSAGPFRSRTVVMTRIRTLSLILLRGNGSDTSAASKLNTSNSIPGIGNAFEIGPVFVISEFSSHGKWSFAKTGSGRMQKKMENVE